jgi:hypothetical protein
MTGGVHGSGNGNGEGERLDSWKAIAAYLGRDAGTVRRWERTRGLPVHRVPGGKGSSVFAFASEIDLWLKSAGRELTAEEAAGGQGEQAARPIGRWPWAAAAVVIFGLLVAGWLTQRPSADAVDLRVHLNEQAVVASDGDGRELWVHRLDDRFRHIKSDVSEPVRITSGPDPRVYYLTSQRIGRSDNTADGGELTSLDSGGHPRFTFRFFDSLLFAGKYFGAPWAPTSFSVLDSEPVRLAVAAHHWVWSPSLIAILDDQGNRLGTYVSHGWIEQLHWLSRDRLVFGGFLESKNGGMVGLLDPAQLDGQAPEPRGTPHHCENCGNKPPLRMAVMPRSEVNLVTQSRFNRAIIEKTADRLIVRTVEVPPLDGQGAADAIYEFTPALELVSATYSQRYWEYHDRLQQEKKLDHDRAHCPFKDGPREIHVWSPEKGWTALAIR